MIRSAIASSNTVSTHLLRACGDLMARGKWLYSAARHSSGGQPAVIDLELAHMALPHCLLNIGGMILASSEDKMTCKGSCALAYFGSTGLSIPFRSIQCTYEKITTRQTALHHWKHTLECRLICKTKRHVTRKLMTLEKDARSCTLSR